METERINEVAKEIFDMAGNMLTINLRFLDGAIGRLKAEQSSEIMVASTDGRKLMYNPHDILRLYKKEKTNVARLYLHCILHCVFQHFYIGPGIDRECWDIAVDIAVENIINELELERLNTARREEQMKAVETLKKHVKFLTAEHIYKYLLKKKININKYKKQLSELFAMDNHDLWYRSSKEAIKAFAVSGEGAENVLEKGEGEGSIITSTEDLEAVVKEWKSVSEHVQMELIAFDKRKGTAPGAMAQNLLEVTRERYDYTAFLKKFAVMGEAMKVNDDEFDYIFYTYGLRLYENMPLVEPLEYKDVKRIKEFVIAIDTSGSTSGKLVQAFLQKTYNILKQEESFFTKINLHIIQCDAQIQEVVKITSQEEFDEYIKTMTIKGLGGTDFRPVFQYVDKLIEAKEFTNLKGMIYFTDGNGAFPKLQPNYQTAVVYVDDSYNNYDVPVWAIKLVLKPEEI